jgi:hypothetical protein
MKKKKKKEKAEEQNMEAVGLAGYWPAAQLKKEKAEEARPRMVPGEFMEPMFWPLYPKYSGKLIKKRKRLFPPSAKKQREDDTIIDRDILGMLLDMTGKQDVRFYQDWDEFLKIENMPVPKATYKPMTLNGVDYETDPAAVIMRHEMTSIKFQGNIAMINAIKDKTKKLECFEKLEPGWHIFYPKGYLEGYLKTSQDIAHSLGISFTYHFFLEYIRQIAIAEIFPKSKEDFKAIEQDCLARGEKAIFYQLPKNAVREIKDDFLVKI